MSMDLATTLHGITMSGLRQGRSRSDLSDTARLKLLNTLYGNGSGTARVMRRYKVADMRVRNEWMQAARRQAAAAGRANDEPFIQKLFRQFTARY